MLATFEPIPYPDITIDPYDTTSFDINTKPNDDRKCPKDAGKAILIIFI